MLMLVCEEEVWTYTHADKHAGAHTHTNARAIVLFMLTEKPMQDDFGNETNPDPASEGLRGLVRCHSSCQNHL